VVYSVTKIGQEHAGFDFKAFSSALEAVFDPVDDFLPFGRGWLSLFLGRHCAKHKLFY
jgi:hypothetical protein